MKQQNDQPIRVLVVEDSRAQRELMVGLLQQAGGFIVAGTATNGQDAIAATLRLKPDVIAMDIHLPVLDGYDAARQIMQRCPTPIVMISSSRGDAALRSVQALAAGALTVIPKPEGPSLQHDNSLRVNFLTTLRLMAGVRVVTRYPPRVLPLTNAKQRAGEEQDASGRPAATPGMSLTPRVLGIAASTGGPAALQTVLRGLGPHFPLPVLIVQHIAHSFVEALVEWLNNTTPLLSRIAQHNERLQPGCAYLAPDDYHLTVRVPGVATLQSPNSEDRFCPSADMLFESLSIAYGARAMGVVLTGMGDDGTRGLLSLRNAGGRTLAQDKASCVVYGMPQAAIGAGAIMRIASLDAMADTIMQVMNIA